WPRRSIDSVTAIRPRSIDLIAIIILAILRRSDCCGDHYCACGCGPNRPSHGQAPLYWTPQLDESPTVHSFRFIRGSEYTEVVLATAPPRRTKPQRRRMGPGSSR